MISAVHCCSKVIIVAACPKEYWEGLWSFLQKNSDQHRKSYFGIDVFCACGGARVTRNQVTTKGNDIGNQIINLQTWSNDVKRIIGWWARITFTKLQNKHVYGPAEADFLPPWNAFKATIAAQFCASLILVCTDALRWYSVLWSGIAILKTLLNPPRQLSKPPNWSW